MLLLAGTALLCLTSCGLDSEARAVDTATDSVRSRAELARRTAVAVLADPHTAERDPAGQLAALAGSVGTTERFGTVFASRSSPDERLEVDVYYDGTANGGGFVAAEVHVRLCVRLAGVAEKDPQVTMTDTACPGIPDGSDRRIVKLTD
ncbi:MULTISPECIES: hypothetical protein [unclassified Micromonospora]|uniref:hypothetical protein n=1 Tax=unclassified Micromonospora TaxID=2617518 RepID=UPI001C5CCD29|nr:hypothetical protein [Micromonospora sp. RL09-050-HVF-A]MBW4703919.1 hypothetical protein [Micromonospora sp. RL09-050-HVF-A]